MNSSTTNMKGILKCSACVRALWINGKEKIQEYSGTSICKSFKKWNLILRKWLEEVDCLPFIILRKPAIQNAAWYHEALASNIWPLCSISHLQSLLSAVYAQQIFIFAILKLDFRHKPGIYLQSVKLITTTFIPVSYRAGVLSYADLIKLCHGELIRLDLHIEMFFVLRTPWTLSTWALQSQDCDDLTFPGPVFPPPQQLLLVHKVVSAHQS